MKHIFLLFISVTLLFGLGEMSKIPADEKVLLTNILSNLSLSKTSNKNKIKLYKTFDFALESGWFSNYAGNDSLESSKLEKSSVKTAFVKIVTKKRIYDFVFVYFPKQRQVLIKKNQYISANADAILEKYEEEKAKKENELLHENNNYGMLRQKGYLSEDVYYIDGKEGIVNYNSLIILDLNK